MGIKETQKPAREFRPLFDRAVKLIQQRYPDWIEASRLDRKEITISECLDTLICFASDELGTCPHQNHHQHMPTVTASVLPLAKIERR
jgi:hypothetical protein